MILLKQQLGDNFLMVNLIPVLSWLVLAFLAHILYTRYLYNE